MPTFKLASNILGWAGNAWVGTGKSQVKIKSLHGD